MYIDLGKPFMQY